MKTTLILPVPEGSTPLVVVSDIIHEKDPLFKLTSKSVERIIHLARILKVSPSEISKYLKIEIGNLLSEGDIIASKKTMFGKTTIKSPEKGLLKSIDLTSGTLTIESEVSLAKKDEEILSTVSGKVIRISDGEIEIETEGHMVGGKKGEGNEVSGLLSVSPLSKISLYDALDNVSGSILLVSEVDDDVVTKLDVIGVLGLVVKKELKDSILPWVLIDESAFEKLKKHHDKKVMIRPTEGIIVLI